MRTPRQRSASPAHLHGALLLLLALEASAAHGDPGQPSTLQLGAPAVNSAAADLLDHADFAPLAGAAWEQRLADVENRHAITFTATPLGLTRLLRGPASSDGLGSRIAARVTVGGPLQFADSLRVSRAGRATDHLTSELKLRLRDGAAAPGRAPIALALALGADNLGTGFGLDRYLATLIAERRAPWAWTANAGIRFLERYRSRQRLAETKLGAGSGWRCWGAARAAVDVGVSGACLLRNHGRSTVYQGAVRADLLLRSGWRLTAGFRASDRPEIRGDDRLRGVLGLAYALGGGL